MNEIQKRLSLLSAILLGWIVLSAQGASFDCAKAGTKVEHLICDDPEISKLDDELGVAYKTALQDEKQADYIKYVQKQWMKDRNECADVGCVKRAYEERLTTLSFSNGDSYSLAMSKDPKLCNAMLTLYNEDMKNFHGIRYDQHEMFTRMWKSVDQDEANHPTYGCSQLWRGIFDINNDGKNELVVKWSACLSGNLTDSLYIYPSDSDVLTFNPKSGKLNPLTDTDNELGSQVYHLKALPETSEFWVGGLFVLQPFIWDGTNYISMTDIRPRWIVIAKYKQAAEMQDICYFFNPHIKHFP